jgi:amino acid transporter
MSEQTPPPANDEPKAHQRKASFLQTMRAVAWSFFGIRRSSGLEEDVKKLNPIHVVVAGLLGAALFVALLVTLVHYVVGSGAAR